MRESGDSGPPFQGPAEVDPGLRSSISEKQYQGLRILQALVSPYSSDGRVHVTLDASADPRWVEALRAGFDWISAVVYVYESKQRVKAGTRGPRSRITADDITRARALREQGKSYKAIAQEMHWCYATAFRYVRDVGVKRLEGPRSPSMPAKEMQ